MTIDTREGSLVKGAFGLTSNSIPTLEGPVATVEQEYDGRDTWLNVEITSEVVGATSYIITVLDAATMAIVGVGLIEGTTGDKVVRLPVVDDTTRRVFQIVATNSVAYQSGFDQTAIIALTEVDPPVLTATTEGDAFNITPPVWSVTPISVTYVIQEDADGVGDGTPLDPTPSVVPDDGATKYYRLVYTAYGPAGDGPITSTSAYTGPIDAAPTLDQLVRDSTAVMGDSFYWPTSGQTIWVKPSFTFPGAAGSVFEWTTTDPLAYPNDDPAIDWKPFEDVGGGEYWPVDVSLAADSEAGRPANFSVWRFNPDSSDLAKMRVRQGDGLGDWSPISLPSWTIEEPAVTPPTTDAAWRDVRLRAAAQLGVTPDNSDLFEDGILSGGAGQWMTSGAWSADGSKCGISQDSGQFMFSQNAGRTWYRPKGEGCKVSLIKCIQADPNNTSRWFAICSARSEQSDTFTGIFVSSDDLATMTRVKAIPDKLGAQHAMDGITCYPLSGGASATWYAAFNKTNATNLPVLYRSNADNGATWGNEIALTSTFGRIYTLRATGTSGTLLMGTGNGLKRSTTNGNTWGAFPGNLPAGAVRSFWVDPSDAAHMYATLSTASDTTYGLYETNNATAGSPTWTRIRQCPAHWLAVGASSGGDRTLYVRCGATGSGTTATNNTDHIRLRTGTWITRATASPNKLNFNIAGAQNNIQPFSQMCTLNIHSSESPMRHTWVRAHPTDPDTFLVHCNTSMARTTDQGLNVNITGYDGMQWRDAYYDLTDKDNIVGTFHDTGMAYSTDGHLSHYQIRFAGFKQRVETVFGGQINSFSGLCVTQLPDNVSVAEADWRGRVIGGAGTTGSTQGAIFYVNKGATTMSDHMGVTPVEGQSNSTGGGWGSRISAGFLRHNPNKVWCGQNIVNLASSTTWGTTTGNRSVFGAAQDGTDTLYAVSTSGNGAVYKATNPWGGGSFSTLYSFTSNIHENSAPVGAVSPYDGRRMFIRQTGRSFRMIHDVDGAVTDILFNLEGTIVFNTPYALDARISSICGDTLDERYIYIATDTVGVDKRLFRGKFNAAFTSITWENITENSGYGAPGIDVFPTGLSGCVHAGHYGLGSVIYPSPDDWQPRVGWYKFSGQPTNGQNIVLNGQTWTFVTSGAAGPQTNIGASLSATLTALATDLNASVDADLTPCTYTARYGDRLEVVMDSPTQGVDEPFVLTAGTTSNATVYDNVVPCKDYVWLNLALPVRSV
jgi:hypothetical protein